ASHSGSRSRRLVVSCPDPWRRLIVAHTILTIDDLNPLRPAPACHEGTRDHRVSEMHRDGIVDHAPDAAWRPGPTIRAGILVEPALHPIEAFSETANRHGDP